MFLKIILRTNQALNKISSESEEGGHVEAQETYNI